MLTQLLNNAASLLIIALFLAFLWWTGRLYEITYEGKIDRLPEWMQTWSKTLKMTQEPPGRAWRWILAGLLIVLDLFYLVTLHASPFLIRLFAVIINLVVFGTCVCYCDKKMGK